jgi:hypothetical protein
MKAQLKKVIISVKSFRRRSLKFPLQQENDKSPIRPKSATGNFSNVPVWIGKVDTVPAFLPIHFTSNLHLLFDEILLPLFGVFNSLCGQTVVLPK